MSIVSSFLNPGEYPKIADISQILQTKGIQFAEADEVKPSPAQQMASSSNGYAPAPYEAFDPMDGYSLTEADDDSLTMSMLDFLQNEAPKAGVLGSTAPKTFNVTPSQTIGMMSSIPGMDEEMLGLDSPTISFIPFNLSGSVGSVEPLAVEQHYGQISAQIQGQLADIANKVHI